MPRARLPFHYFLLLSALSLFAPLVARAEDAASYQPRLPTGLLEGAYISRIDGSLQPYRLFIPSYAAQPTARPKSPHFRSEGDYSPSPATSGDERKRLPLVVMLHGYAPNLTLTNWMNISPKMALALEKAGLAMLLTFGRSNTDFLGIGEVDTFDAIEDAAGRYPIDRNRLYLAGYSMGGSGVWTTLCHYPGVFASGAVFCGRTDFYLWQNLDRETVPPYLRLLIDTDNPMDLAENLCRVPLYVSHARDDLIVKCEQTELMVERLNALGREAPLIVNLPDKGDHVGLFQELEDPETYRRMLKYSLDPLPEEVEIATFTPKYGANAWLRICEMREWGKRAHVKARLLPPSPGAHVLIQIETLENVAALGLNVHRLPALERQARPTGEATGGKKPLEVQFPEGWRCRYTWGGPTGVRLDLYREEE
ncbi:MAG: prolyl oligopeptidase family serine peptidase, partial [Planctomycetota bacterium]